MESVYLRWHRVKQLHTAFVRESVVPHGCYDINTEEQVQRKTAPSVAKGCHQSHHLVRIALRSCKVIVIVSLLVGAVAGTVFAEVAIAVASSSAPYSQPIIVPTVESTPTSEFADIQIETVSLSADSSCSGTFHSIQLDHQTSAPGGDTIEMYEANGSGLAINDLDNDGDLDIVLGNHGGSNTIL